MLRKNVASQFVHIAGVNATTGAIVTGASWTMRRCLDGTFAAGGATVTEDGTTGFYKVALAQADTNGNDIGYFFTATSCVPVTINALTTTVDPSTDTTQTGDAYAVVNSGTFGNSALKTIIDTKSSQTSVDDLPTNAELATALGTADDAVLTAIGDLPTNAELATALGTADDAVLTAIGDLPTNAELATALGTADDAVLSAIAALNNLSAAQAQTAAAAALLAYGTSTFDPAVDVIEGAITWVKGGRLWNSAAGGKASGLETTNAKYRDLADSKDRIDATVDVDGNRTAVTLDLT